MIESRPGDDQAEIIRSPDNRTIKLVRSLHLRKHRAAERAFVVEGLRAIGDALDAGAVPTTLLLRDGDERGSPLVERLGSSPVVVRTVAAGLFDVLSDTVTPQGAIAVFPVPDLPIRVQSPFLFLVVDQIRDPGNLGSLLRTAAAAAVTAVVLTGGSVDPFNPKVVRSAMGAHFRIPIRWFSESLKSDLIDRCPLRVLAEPGAAVSYDRVDWTVPALVIVGGEAEGPSDEMRSLATVAAGIPLADEVESLNAGVAGAVVLFEAIRQRRRREEGENSTVPRA